MILNIGCEILALICVLSNQVEEKRRCESSTDEMVNKGDDLKHCMQILADSLSFCAPILSLI